LLAVRALANLLYATSPFDPLVLSLVPAVLVVIGLLASWLPARRAASLSAVSALRDQA
jgi:ABC-type lipoprotein release transport system permease subunit